MTASEIVLIIAAVGTAIVSIVQSFKTHNAVNSRMDKFLAEQKVHTDAILKVGTEAAHAAGVKQATDTMKAMASATPLAVPVDSGPVEVAIVPDPKKPVPVVMAAKGKG